MPPKKKTRTATPVPDVRKPADLKALLDTIAAHPITVILIHADYCGHCQTYKKNVWNKLSELPNKKNGMASIHYDQVEGTPFADAKIKGYPSVIIVGKKKMAEFEDEDGDEPGATTNAIPIEEANNEEKMKTLVTSAEPSTLMGTVKNIKTNVDSSSEEQSPELNEEAKSLRELKGDTPDTVSLEPAPEEGAVSAPDVRSDVLNSQKKAPESLEFTPEQANEAPMRPVAGKGAVVGGSLYSSLLEAARTAGPAVALTAAAVAMGRRTSRKGRRASRKGRQAYRKTQKRRARR